MGSGSADGESEGVLQFGLRSFVCLPAHAVGPGCEM